MTIVSVTAWKKIAMQWNCAITVCAGPRVSAQNRYVLPSRVEVNLLMVQVDRHSRAMNALTKNHEDELVELHKQRELKKRIPSSTRERIGCLIQTH